MPLIKRLSNVVHQFLVVLLDFCKRPDKLIGELADQRVFFFLCHKISENNQIKGKPPSRAVIIALLGIRRNSGVVFRLKRDIHFNKLIFLFDMERPAFV